MVAVTDSEAFPAGSPILAELVAEIALRFSSTSFVSPVHVNTGAENAVADPESTKAVPSAAPPTGTLSDTLRGTAVSIAVLTGARLACPEIE